MYPLFSGIYIEHDEFTKDRAVWGKSFLIPPTDTDLNGHGTHVAGAVIEHIWHCFVAHCACIIIYGKPTKYKGTADINPIKP